MSDSFGDEKACRPYGTRDSVGMPTQPAAAGWAKLCRPARRDWVVVGLGWD